MGRGVGHLKAPVLDALMIKFCSLLYSPSSELYDLYTVL